jgi:hypothetical protein
VKMKNFKQQSIAVPHTSHQDLILDTMLRLHPQLIAMVDEKGSNILHALMEDYRPKYSIFQVGSAFGFPFLRAFLQRKLVGVFDFISFLFAISQDLDDYEIRRARELRLVQRQDHRRHAIGVLLFSNFILFPLCYVFIGHSIGESHLLLLSLD